jgi:hypothetical protein
MRRPAFSLINFLAIHPIRLAIVNTAAYFNLLKVTFLLVYNFKLYICFNFYRAMKLLLEIKDDKAEFFLELLKNLPFVKAQSVMSDKQQLSAELSEAVENLKLVRKGKMKAKPIDELINEL